MKKITYLIVATGLLWACSKSEIEIQKNTDTSWEIDKKIQDEDIRNIIGYDPRFEYVYSDVSEIEVPMLTLANFKITDKNTRQLQVKLSKPIEQDIKVSLAYDAALFEQVKQNHSGYELGEMSLVEITSPEQTLTKGTTSTTFELKIQNQEGFNKKLIVPLAIKVATNDVVKTLNKRDYVLVKVLPKDIVFEADTDITKTATLDSGRAQMTNKGVIVDVAVSDPIPTAISLGLERDNALVTGKRLATDGMEGTITKINFQNKTTGEISFELQNVETLTEQGDYVLPLKLMAYDAMGQAHQILKEPILVTIKVSDVGIPEDNEVEEVNTITESLLSGGYQFKSNYQPNHLQKLSDGRTNTGNWWIDTYRLGDNAVYLKAEFSVPTLVKGIKIKQLSTGKRISSVVISASDSGEDESYIDQGMYVSTSSKGELYLRFKKPIMAKSILFSEFSNEEGQYIDLHEVEFF